MHVKMSKIGNSLEVQWLGLSFHGKGTKILQATQFGQKEENSRISTERIGRIRTKIRLGEKKKAHSNPKLSVIKININGVDQLFKKQMIRL